MCGHVVDGAHLDLRRARDNRVIRHMIFAQIAKDTVIPFIDPVVGWLHAGRVSR
jgi:hypothetical protein